jgi:hypothetical protein
MTIHGLWRALSGADKYISMLALKGIKKSDQNPDLARSRSVAGRIEGGFAANE